MGPPGTARPPKGVSLSGNPSVRARVATPQVRPSTVCSLPCQRLTAGRLLETFCRTNERTRTMFVSLRRQLVAFLTNEDGPTAVEYAVMLALIIVVCITAVATLGSNA